MRASISVAMCGALALFGVGCAPSYQVHTMTAPEVSLGAFSTFRLLPIPSPRDGRSRAGAYDPMVNNSIANRALRETIAQSLVGRGYVAVERAPDFDVAAYASAREKLDVTVWDYGYPYWGRSRWARPPRETVTEYTEGTVIVDVVHPTSRELLWRGSGTARLAEDVTDDIKELQKVVKAVIKKIPRAAKR